MNEWKLFNDSVCVKPETEEISVPPDSGMQGEAMPYKLVSDSNVMLAIVSGLLLIVIALQNEKKELSEYYATAFPLHQKGPIYSTTATTPHPTFLLYCCVVCHV